MTLDLSLILKYALDSDITRQKDIDKKEEDLLNDQLLAVISRIAEERECGLLDLDQPTNAIHLS